MRRAWCLLVAAVAVLPFASSGCAARSTPSTGRPVEGGVATFAEPANATPSYIFPFMSGEHFDAVSISDLQSLLYRPLYWFGEGGRPVVDEGLSLAEQPAFSDGNRTVTVDLKDYSWSNGEKVTADDVVFWMNMMKAEKQNWAVYSPGRFPDDVDSVAADSPTRVTFHLNQSYNQKWFLYNELSQITPMPKAWDRTAAGPSDCTHRQSDCPAVHEYLSGQAAQLSTYATNPLWGVVDGPWRLKSFRTDGHVSFVPNPAYSGPNKPHLAEFREVPFADNKAEYNVLRSGENSVQVGYLPAENAPIREAGQPVGRNPLAANYSLERWRSLSTAYFPMNMHNPETGPIVRQTYARQALQSLVDQKSVVRAAMHGYGSVTTGPVPTNPPNPYADERTQPDQLPFDPQRARRLLASHGWSTPPDGVGRCVRPGTGPGQCGPGVRPGQPLEFDLLYASGTQRVQLFMQQFQSAASRIGVRVNLRGAPFNTVVGTATSCQESSPECSWQVADWGGGWVFAPDYYPTGEQIFSTGAGSNQGGFSDPKLDQLVERTQHDDSPQAMQEYERYGGQLVPALWMPQADYEILEIANNLKGVRPLSPYLNITPENWYYVR